MSYYYRQDLEPRFSRNQLHVALVSILLDGKCCLRAGEPANVKCDFAGRSERTRQK